MQARRSRLAQQKALVDQNATEARLQELLVAKMDAEEPASPQGKSAASSPHTQQSLKARQTQSSASLAEGNALAPSIEMEHLRNEYVSQVCSDTTRFDVRQWVGKIFYMQHARQMAAESQRQADANDMRRRRVRHQTHSSATSTVSDTQDTQVHSSDAGTTWMSPSTRAARTTFMSTAGPQSSQHAESHRSTSGALMAADALSAESMVVNHDPVDADWNVRERLKAYLSNQIPELTKFVDDSIMARTDALRREVDQELKEKHLRMMSMRQVFDARANQLRWEHIRRAALQRRLDAEMTTWIVQAIKAWDQKKAMQTQRAIDISETDLVFDYLTKRAAHIDSGKLPTELPIFKALHASYSLPEMWRDKY
eukprot:CAMPEP_0178405468 /NCGR_PEP_ID=MMETSP0689_2-20121128/18414_1 /TAXON_ID=160604 /ORGANISM="Amphidinium massartii, Strain CS-259" /LENGTH=367 /DNA_ID=CAMNT_0020026483 /DNA_START=78 /DNA_END=1181 /DNA_ORIENTATION=+